VITGERSWRLTRSGCAVVGDDVVRASYEGFGGYHTELYRDLLPLLRGGPARQDTAEQGELIARLTAAVFPLVRSRLVHMVTERRPRRVLHIGCGAGRHLAAMLEAARDIQKALSADRPGALADQFELALLADVIYYLPAQDRVALLHAVARLLAPGGALVIVTTVAGPRLFSRHLPGSRCCSGSTDVRRRLLHQFLPALVEVRVSESCAADEHGLRCAHVTRADS